MKLAIVNCTTFFSANDGTARTHLFFKKILPLFFAVFFADDIEVFDGKTFPSLNNDPCAPMKYPLWVNICLIVSLLLKFKNFIWPLLEEFDLHFPVHIYGINSANVKFVWIKNSHPFGFFEDKVLLEYRVKCR